MLTPRRRGVTLTETLVVSGVTAAMMALLLPAILSSINTVQSSNCRNNLARLGQALNAYHDARGKFPPGMQDNPIGSNGSMRPSWVILILPYIDQQALYDSVNWSTVNTISGGLENYTTAGGVTFGAFTGSDVPQLRCPADANWNVQYAVNANPNKFSGVLIYQYYGRTSYAANACLMPPFNYGDANFGLGVNAFPCGGPTQAVWSLSSPYSWKTRGVMGLNASVSRAQITDGTSKTVLLGETRSGLNSSDPRGIWADGTAAGSTTWFHIWGPNYCYDDLGSGNVINAIMSALGNGNTTLGHQIAQQQCMDAYSSSSGRPLGNFRSQHDGGFFAVMCDGSVRFISNSVEFGNVASGPGGVYGWPLSSDTTRMLTWERLMASGDGLIVDESTDSNFDNTVVPFILGDMNGDGVLDGNDIAAFVLALTNPDQYLVQYPTLTDYVQRGDVNQDGYFDGDDIEYFVEWLTATN